MDRPSRSFDQMPLLTELEINWLPRFYKDAAPDGAAALVLPDCWSPVEIRRRRGHETQISPADTE